MKAHTWWKVCSFFIISVVLGTGLFSCSGNTKEMKIVHNENGISHIIINSTNPMLLLPIQEDAPESTVQIVKGSDVAVPMHIRLAHSRIDYYVPFNLPGEADEINIEVISKGAENLLWDKFKLSDTFDTANTEKYRPVYHHTPQYGWMNDPNGMVYLDGEYHLFYQWNPYGSMWGNMHWGHAVSHDLVHWKHLGMAIAPDSLGTVFSGNCIVDAENVTGFGKDAIVAFYTSAGQKQTQSIAYSTDKGRTFQKYHNNPVVTAEIPDFRDPKVFYHNATGKWIMVIAAGQEVQLFSSVNLLDWVYESSFGEGYGNHGGVWECPDLLELPLVNEPGKSKWVLLLNINPGGPFGGSATQYFTGTFDGKTFRCESKPETEKWMDWGKDHYATVTWSNAPDNRALAIAWMSNWQYANHVPTHQFRSANSVPREIRLYKKGNETYLINEPVKELISLRKDEQNYPSVIVDRETPFHLESILKQNNGAFELELEFSNQSAEIFGLTLFNEQGESVDIYYNIPEKRFYTDRTKSGNTGFSRDFPAVTCAPLETAETYSLRIFVDKCSIECFSGDGKFVMTNLIFPETPYNRINFYSKGGTFTIKSCNIYTLAL